MTHRGPGGGGARRLPLVRFFAALVVPAVLLALPGAVAAHGLSPVYQSPLPLAVYLVGAAVTVALSFAFVLARDMRAGPIPEGRIVAVPAPLRVILRLVGIIGWAWIMAQGIAGGSSNAEVATLFLWVYGWVVIAAVSALVGPVWQWMDPFATLHATGAWLLARVGIRGWSPGEVPGWLRTWPAVIGISVVIWLELVAVVDSPTLTLFLAGYTVFTLAMMAQFGRDAWRAQGETFSVWFSVLGRLAPFAAVPAAETSSGGADVDPDAIDGRMVSRRPFASGLLLASWRTPEIVLVALATGSIIYDGLSQTAPWVNTFGVPSLAGETVLLAVFLGAIVAAAMLVARAVSPGAIGAGLLPIAVGYLVGHYLTYVLIDGQRIVIAISDPLQLGWDLFGTVFFEPTGDWLPPGLVWTVQLAAVVGGHMLGAWAGHVAAVRDLEARDLAAVQAGGREARDMRHRRIRGANGADAAGAAAGAGAARTARSLRRREIPLAVVMVALTTLTLWSLGQAIVSEEEDEAGRPAQVLAESLRADASGRSPADGQATGGTHSTSARRRDLRVDRLRGGDRRLDRGQAEHALGDRRVADLRRVADRAGPRRGRVDDEADIARGDELQDRHLAGSRPGWRRASRPDAPRGRPRRAPHVPGVAASR
jgi:hypothetical protein